MDIARKDAVKWFEFFAQLPEEEELAPRQQEIALATLAQIERAVEHRRAAMLAEIPGLKSLKGRTLYVGEDAKFLMGCRSCLLGRRRLCTRCSRRLKRRRSAASRS